ncbi:acyl-CoA N-acyltransferase [Coccomyxa subellipsoidea C-169]|uniref:Acyl-CoA N-acyltransferase n=1 Tax=Coccomyxa subellipsoidea (strain C-169) TaxID=574566 RepID=I0Z0X4_COCSC|nr:acyl-CoA N-acyltransferase [Coccomyxa subellipsoidea C-169]EIE24293.1 acyl-CoA N-acyltransferase [Coccomyxa subellipsoidea C-169]|eukprot:XP_005648837.1 acyl-CoA N-acyltransferase [Coccomyxa subellipsoidea C-169]
MKARSVSVLGGETRDKEGKNVTFREMGKMFGIDFQKKYGKSLFFLGWHEIRETLYEALPPGVVDFGRRYASYDDQGADGVIVNFKDGSSVRARMLIGADGYFSKVRRQMLDDGPPEFTGNIMWRARFPLRQEFSTDRTRWWKENLDSFGGRFAVIFPIDKDHVTFVANAPVEHLHRHNLPFQADTSRSVQEDVYEKDNLQRCLTVFHDFDERLLEVLRDTDPSTVTEHGLYERPVAKMPDEGWCRGNVTIIGDAAHAGLPNGQGLNLAIEDGAVLGWHVREGGVTPEALQKFNAERGPRVREVLTKGLDNNTGPEKIRVIYETTFRPVQGDRPGVQEHSAAVPEPGTAGQQVYAGVPFRQWLSPNGQWRVRPIREEEVGAVARLQAQAFHESSSFAPLDSLLYYVFQGEVLSGLQQKMKYSHKDGFCCLVASAASDPDKIVGVVEVSLQGEKEELNCLAEKGFAEESYAYVACMAVDRNARRGGAASALLGAAERMAGKWQQNWVLLHVYGDNFPGIRLYHRNGYADLHIDPEWWGFMGRRRRVLMAKSASVFSVGRSVQSISTNVLKMMQQQSWQEQQEQGQL